jgi:ankyrin repeat protein
MSPSYFKLGRERLQVVEALLKDDADANVLDKNGRTPLHLVSERGYVDGARILLNSGADTKSRDKDNMTPLHLALQNGHLEVAKLLSSYPVDPNTHGKDGQTALHLAVQIPRRYVLTSVSISTQDVINEMKLHVSVHFQVRTRLPASCRGPS